MGQMGHGSQNVTHCPLWVRKKHHSRHEVQRLFYSVSRRLALASTTHEHTETDTQPTDCTTRTTKMVDKNDVQWVDTIKLDICMHFREEVVLSLKVLMLHCPNHACGGE